MTGPEVSVFALCDGVACRRPRPGAGLQARRRRRHRPQHRRHGRLQPAAVARPRLRRRRDQAVRRSRPSTSSAGGASTTAGVLYTGLMVTDEGPKLRRVQHPLRRPRRPGRAPAPDHRPRRSCCTRPPPASCAPRRPSTPVPRCWWSPPPRATRPPCGPATPSRGSTPPGALEGVDVLCAGVAAGRRAARDRRRPRRSRSSAEGPTCRPPCGRAYAGVEPSSTGPALHHRTDIATDQ